MHERIQSPLDTGNWTWLVGTPPGALSQYGLGLASLSLGSVRNLFHVQYCRLQPGRLTKDRPCLVLQNDKRTDYGGTYPLDK